MARLRDVNTSKPMSTSNVALRERTVKKNGVTYTSFRGSLQLPDGSSLSLTIQEKGGKAGAGFVNHVEAKGKYPAGKVVWLSVAEFQNSGGNR